MIKQILDNKKDEYVIFARGGNKNYDCDSQFCLFAKYYLSDNSSNMVWIKSVLESRDNRFGCVDMIGSVFVTSPAGLE